MDWPQIVLPSRKVNTRDAQEAGTGSTGYSNIGDVSQMGTLQANDWKN